METTEIITGIELPTLTGVSEKQIKYGTEMRQRVISGMGGINLYVGIQMNEVKSFLDSGKITQKQYDMVENLFRTTFEALFRAKTEAKFWIENASFPVQFFIKTAKESITSGGN